MIETIEAVDMIDIIIDTTNRVETTGTIGPIDTFEIIETTGDPVECL